ncbi:hypothetical protein RHGRI_008614 [Rhododendron griersonianum]|uniref:Uncharacterized protein n=1 Tax=Rhododendron griersonianum TaxID=479676 RepID=A0AAV6L2D1_9ERIC|nr:hypothetical protein RHGRI_008614 [Rhododendron griersonianum]
MAFLGSCILCLIPFSLLFGLCFSFANVSEFKLELSYITLSPLGVPQQVIAVNGTFPGPVLNVTSNHLVNVTVTNKLDENLLITWAGLRMRRAFWQDGVLGTNCPIPPSSSWTYEFQVKDQIGSFYYFPSLNLQRSAGGFGSFIINNLPGVPPPFDTPYGDIVVFIGDWYKQSHKALRGALDNGTDLGIPDGVLINGKGPYNKTEQPFDNEKGINVVPGKTYRIRVHNVGVSTCLNFRIQNHDLFLVETEGRYTAKQKNSSFDIHVGQSYSFLVTMNQDANSDYYIVASPKFMNPNQTYQWQNVIGVAILYYSELKGNASDPLPTDPVPPNGVYNTSLAIEQSMSIRQDLNAIISGSSRHGSFEYSDLINSSELFILRITQPVTIDGKLRATFNGISFENPGYPIRLADQFDKSKDVYNLDFPNATLPSGPPRIATSLINGTYNHSMQLILQNNDTVVQSFHMDGHSFFVLGMGLGEWTENNKTLYNTNDSIWRSTIQVIAVNGMFPGPVLNVTTSHIVNVTVTNKLDENLLITWAGLRMRRDFWQDGVLGTNCPIPQDHSWTYQFQVKDQIGSFFYFPSLNLQRSAGGFGSFIINNLPRVPPPFDTPYGDIVVFIGDWYKQSHKALRGALDNGTDLGIPDGVLINGKGPYHETINVVPGKTYRIRVHNVGVSTCLNFQIQKHDLVLVETEGHYTARQNNTSFYIHVGQSFSFLVTMNQDANSNYSIVASPKFMNPNQTYQWQNVIGVAILYYELKGKAAGRPPTDPVPPNGVYNTSLAMEQSESIRQDLNANVSGPSRQGSFNYSDLINSSEVFILRSTQPETIDGKLRATFNGISFKNPAYPIRLADQFDKSKDVYKLDFPNATLPSGPPRIATSLINGTYNHSMELILQNNDTVVLSFHMDGYSFFVLGMGLGEWTQNNRSLYSRNNAIWRSTVQALRGALDNGTDLGIPDGVLINGKGPYSLTEPFDYEKINVVPGKTYRIQVHNVGVSICLNFQIQNHDLLLVETEGHYTAQQNNSSFDIHVGQSYTFLVTMNQSADSNYYIVTSPKFVNPNQYKNVIGVAILYYSNLKGNAADPNGVYDTSLAMEQSMSIRQDLNANGSGPSRKGAFE